MNRAIRLAILAKPESRPETYLRAWYTTPVLEAVSGSCCGRPVCRTSIARAGRILQWLERSLWAGVGEA